MTTNTLTPSEIDFIQESLVNNQFSFFCAGTRFSLNSCFLETSLYFKLDKKILELNFRTGYTIPNLNNKTFNLNDIVINLDEIILFDKNSKIEYEISSLPFHNEGLEELKKELMDCSSRYMSISCISIKNKHTHELLWILGNKDYFDNDTGVYAMKTKKSSVAT